jgi:hypothetical protein
MEDMVRSGNFVASMQEKQAVNPKEVAALPRLD